MLRAIWSLVLHKQGRRLDPPINTFLRCRKSGDHSQRRSSGADPRVTELVVQGQIELAKFINPDGLLKNGENMYLATDASGPEATGNPNEEDYGQIVQGSLEASNVEPVQELIDLITTQRAFELNSQAVQAGDQIMQNISNLRRF